MSYAIAARWLKPDSDDPFDGWVAGIIPAEEAQTLLGITRGRLAERIATGEIPTIGAEGGDPNKPLFDLDTIRALIPGTQEALW